MWLIRRGVWYRRMDLKNLSQRTIKTPKLNEVWNYTANVQSTWI